MNPADLAERWLGVQEVAGKASNPDVLRMLQLDASWPTGDDVPWCSAFVNFIAYACRLQRARSLRARSWLLVGAPVPLAGARRGDVVVLTRGQDTRGPDIIDAPGHVGFFEVRVGQGIAIVGGNQGDAVTVAIYPVERVLGVRRLTELEV